MIKLVCLLKGDDDEDGDGAFVDVRCMFRVL